MGTLRSTEFITSAFVETAKINIGYNNFLNSGYAYEFVEKNPTYLTKIELAVIYAEIAKQIKRIEQMK